MTTASKRQFWLAGCAVFASFTVTAVANAQTGAPPSTHPAVQPTTPPPAQPAVQPTNQPSAQPSEDDLIRQGVEQRQQSHDDAALDLFRRAYAITNSPRSLAQVGLAEQALGQWLDAELHLRQALEATHDPWITAHRIPIEGSFAIVQQHIGRLEIQGGVPRAEVWTNGERVGTLPLAQPLRVVAGTVALEVRMPGYYPFSRGVVVTPGGLAREPIRMTALPTATAPLATGTDARANVVVAPTPGALQHTLGLVSIGGAAVFVGLGIVADIIRQGAARNYNVGLAAGHCVGSDLPASTETDPGCQSDRSTGGTMQAISIAGFLTGGVLAVTAAAMLLAPPASQHEHTALQFGCGYGPGVVGVACRGSFL